MIRETAKYSGDNGAYVSVIPDQQSYEKINNYFLSGLRKLGLDEFVLHRNDLHITVIYSKKCAPTPKDLPYLQPEARIKALLVNLQIWPGHDDSGFVVAGIKSPALVALNKFWIDRGCKSDFEEYKPHMTLASGFLENEDTLPAKVPPFLKRCNDQLKQTPLKITLFGHRVEDINE